MYLGLSCCKYVLTEVNAAKLTVILHGSNFFRVKKIFAAMSQQASIKFLHSVPRLQTLSLLQEKAQIDSLTECVKHFSLLEDNISERSKFIAYDANYPLIFVKIENFIKTPVYCLEEISETENKDIFIQTIYSHDINLLNKQSIEHLLLPYSPIDICLPTISCYLHGFLVTNFLLITTQYGFITASKKNELAKFFDEKNTRPTEEQLITIKNCLSDAIIYFFQTAPDFSIYHRDIIFQNNIRGITTRGLSAYMNQSYILRLYGFLLYAKLQSEVLKISYHIEDGTVRARWRIKGLSRHKFLFMLGRLGKHSWKNIIEEESQWMDGFSIFSVNKDGLVFKHVCDKMIPDDDQGVAKRLSLRTRILTLFRLPRRPSPSDIQAMLTYLISQNNHVYKFLGKKT